MNDSNTKQFIERGDYLINPQCMVHDKPIMHLGKLFGWDATVIECGLNEYISGTALATTKYCMKPTSADYDLNDIFYRAVLVSTAKPLKIHLHHDVLSAEQLKHLIKNVLYCYLDLDVSGISVCWSLSYIFVNPTSEISLLEDCMAPNLAKQRADFATLLETIVTASNCSVKQEILADNMFQQLLLHLRDGNKTSYQVARLAKMVFSPYKFMNMLTTVVDMIKDENDKTTVPGKLKDDLRRISGRYFVGNREKNLSGVYGIKGSFTTHDFYELCNFLRNRSAHIMCRSDIGTFVTKLGAEGAHRYDALSRLIEEVEKRGPGFQFVFYDTVIKSELYRRYHIVQQLFE
jgi:hypothetical protein